MRDQNGEETEDPGNNNSRFAWLRTKIGRGGGGNEIKKNEEPVLMRYVDTYYD